MKKLIISLSIFFMGMQQCFTSMSSPITTTATSLVVPPLSFTSVTTGRSEVDIYKFGVKVNTSPINWDTRQGDNKLAFYSLDNSKILITRLDGGSNVLLFTLIYDLLTDTYTTNYFNWTSGRARVQLNKNYIQVQDNTCYSRQDFSSVPCTDTNSSNGLIEKQNDYYTRVFRPFYYEENDDRFTLVSVGEGTRYPQNSTRTYSATYDQLVDNVWYHGLFVGNPAVEILGMPYIEPGLSGYKTSWINTDLGATLGNGAIKREGKSVLYQKSENEIEEISISSEDYNNSLLGIFSNGDSGYFSYGSDKKFISFLYQGEIIDIGNGNENTGLNEGKGGSGNLNGVTLSNCEATPNDTNITYDRLLVLENESQITSSNCNIISNYSNCNTTYTTLNDIDTGSNYGNVNVELSYIYNVENFPNGLISGGSGTIFSDAFIGTKPRIKISLDNAKISGVRFYNSDVMNLFEINCKTGSRINNKRIYDGEKYGLTPFQTEFCAEIIGPNAILSNDYNFSFNVYTRSTGKTYRTICDGSDGYQYIDKEKTIYKVGEDREIIIENAGDYGVIWNDNDNSINNTTTCSNVLNKEYTGITGIIDFLSSLVKCTFTDTKNSVNSLLSFVDKFKSIFTTKEVSLGSTE